MSSERIEFKVPPNPGDVAVIKANADALGRVLAALTDLSDDARKRVLHAAQAFYRVEHSVTR